MLCLKCKSELPDDAKFCCYCGVSQAPPPPQKRKSRGNGQGSVYKTKAGTWCASITLSSYGGKLRRRKKSGFATKKEALDYLPILRNQPSTRDITIAGLYDAWSATHFEHISKGKAGHYKTAFNRLELIWAAKIRDLNAQDLQEQVDKVPGGYYPKSDVKVLLNSLYTFAMANDYCDKNYAEFIKLPPLEKSKKDAFTQEEVDLLWKDYNAGHDYTGYILIMCYTGMRYGEISKIRKDDIHLKDRYMIGGIKTDAGKNRQIAIAENLVPIIEKLLPQAEGPLLLAMKEQPFYRAFAETIERAGITRPMTPHCCRHTFSTMMAQAEVQPAIIKEVAGHANYSTTLGYTHISLDKKLEAVNRLK